MNPRTRRLRRLRRRRERWARDNPLLDVIDRAAANIDRIGRRLDAAFAAGARAVHLVLR